MERLINRMSKWSKPDTYGKCVDDLLRHTKSSNQKKTHKINTASPFHEIETELNSRFVEKGNMVRRCLYNGCVSMLLKYSIPRSWIIKTNGEPLLSKHLVVGLVY